MGKTKELFEQYEEQLDVLDLDYYFEQYVSMHDEKEALSHHFWNQRIAKNGMSYGRIQELDNKMFDLEWKS